MFERLISDVKLLKLPTGSYALFGSAPIIVRGLRQASHDIDIIVKENVWAEYIGQSGWVQKPIRNESYLEWEGHNIELWKTWGPGEWDVEKIINNAEMIDGLPYVKLETVLEWKERNSRPKDANDAKLIREYLLK